MKSYAEILMEARPHVEADEFLDKDYFFKLYMAIRQCIPDVNFQTAIKCVLSDMKGTGKSLSLEDVFKNPTNEEFPTQNKNNAFDKMFEEIKDELPKSNLNNLIWMEAIRQGMGSFDELKETVQRLKRKMINNEKG